MCTFIFHVTPTFQCFWWAFPVRDKPLDVLDNWQSYLSEGSCRLGILTTCLNQDQVWKWLLHKEKCYYSHWNHHVNSLFNSWNGRCCVYHSVCYNVNTLLWLGSLTFWQIVSFIMCFMDLDSNPGVSVFQRGSWVWGDILEEIKTSFSEFDSCTVMTSSLRMRFCWHR